MNLAFLASFIALIIFISISIKKQNKNHQQQEAAFWERERRANFVRNKPLDGLPYIKIPLETFPTNLLHDDPAVLDCIDIIEALTSQKIVNLTGWSNTDLKLEYGTGNIALLSEYDQNYTVLVRTLQKWADALLAASYTEEASVLMEFAVSTGTDISRTYYLLADYWNAQGEWAQVERLTDMAKKLRSSNRDSIVRHLQSHSILHMDNDTPDKP